MLSVFVRTQVAPPSSLRYSPLFDFCGFLVESFTVFGVVSASTCVYMIFGFERAIAISMRPSVVAGNPPPVTLVHEAPASVDFQSADPAPPLCRKYGPRSRS